MFVTLANLGKVIVFLFLHLMLHLPNLLTLCTKMFGDHLLTFQLMEIVILFYLLMIALSLCGFIFFLKNPKFTPCLCNSER